MTLSRMTVFVASQGGGDKMKRVIITIPVLGILYMQVCAIADATDEEILDVCNRENQSGTTTGWAGVIREEVNDFGKDQLPQVCSEYPDRKHFLIYC